MSNKALSHEDVVQMSLARGTAQALNIAAASCVAAAAACRTWKHAGGGLDVTFAAADAQAAANMALEAVITDEPWDRACDEPSTRRARLAYAGWFALLAGTNEHGVAADLDCAAQLFCAAAAG